MNDVAPIRDRANHGRYDAVVVGSGPNGLAAAAMLAKRGAAVLVVEAASTIGGGCRTAELTVPGVKHDVCSAIHPLGLGSPFFRTLPLAQHGLEWVQPEIALAHPFDDGASALLHRSIEETASTLGLDGDRYRRLIEPLTPDWDEFCAALINPLKLAQYPLGLARFGLPSLLSSRCVSDAVFQGGRAKAFFSGMAAHSFLSLESPMTAAFGLVLAIVGHAVGWPVARGGSQAIPNALASYIKSCGGEILTNARVDDLGDLPESKVVLCDVSPRQFAGIAQERLPAGYRRKLLAYRYGPGAFKIDWALDAPVPWLDPVVGRAGTVHLGPTRSDISRSERSTWQGQVSTPPFVLLAQQSVCDPTRLPADRNVHALWGYCHVPSGFDGDCTDLIEDQLERFAPGFRNHIIAKHTMGPGQFQSYNANYIGGDINGGVLDFAQLLARPVLRGIPYATPVRGLYLCSASTPPGGGVHGMCGYYAALAALRDL